MKCTSKYLACLSILAVLGFLANTACGQSTGLYVRGDLGGNITENTGLKEFFGAVTPGSKVKFDPGARFGVAVGYHLTDWLSVEGETGVMANNIESITEATRVDAQFANVPFLANVRIQLPCRCRVTPYLGGGVGGSVSILDADPIDLNGTRMSGSAGSDIIFAYQAFGGLRYKLNDQMGISLEYHYFATQDSDFRADFTVGTDTDHIRLKGVATHAISVAFDITF